MSIFGLTKPYTKSELSKLTVEEAQDELVKAVTKIVKDARWHSYYKPSKINQLRKPLLQLRLAKRKIVEGEE